MTKLLKAIAMTAGSILLLSSAHAERQMSLGERIDTLERIIGAHGDSQVRLSQDIGSVQDELSELRGVSEEHNYKLSQILDRQRELYQELDKLNETTQQIVTLKQTQLGLSTGENVVNNTNLVDPQVSMAPTYQMTSDENNAYERAVNLVLKDKRYEQAIPEFQAFIKQYPDSSYIANAHYWLGQLLFSKGELRQAASSFLYVVEQYKDSAKRPDSIFKLGLVAQKLENSDLAREKFEQVIADYPDSTPAKLAQQRLLEL